MEENKGILGKQANSESVLEKEFTLFELKRALNGAKNTSPGKDGICYKMIKEIDDVAKYGILKLYNKIWEQGKLPLCWKHSVVIPIGKPGKDRTEVKSVVAKNNCFQILEIIFNQSQKSECDKLKFYSILADISSKTRAVVHEAALTKTPNALTFYTHNSSLFLQVTIFNLHLY